MNHFIRFNLSAGQRSLTSLLCMFVCAFSVSAQEYSMTVEAMPSTQEGLTAYRFYINMLDATDRMSAVYGNNEASLEVNAPAGVFNSTFNASWNASGINPAFVPVFPELVDDTYATIGLDGPAASSGLADAADPSVVEDNNQLITPFFLDANATTLLSNTVTGSSWYILNTASNGLPDADMRVLIMQVTTAGNVSGQMNVQVFPLGDGGAAQLLSWTFDGAGQYGGSVDDVLGCTADMACNFNPEATVDDGSCDFTSCINFGCTDEDACNYDMDAAFDDGSCEYANFPYDCDNQCVNDADADGVCDELEVAGCTDESACNFSELATDDGGNCVFPEPPYNCDGTCVNDADGDGICDEQEVPGCDDPTACNYNALATDNDGSCEYTSCAQEGCTDAAACNYNANASIDDGSCDFCSCAKEPTVYTLTVEASDAVTAGLTNYRFYVNLPDEGDRMSAVFGNDNAGLLVSAPEGVFNSTFNASWNASGINPAFLPAFPDLADDTYATIGLDGPAASSGLADAADPSIVEDTNQPITPFFLNDGSTSLVSNTITGSSWYILNTASNGLADANGRVLVMQVTSAGSVSGQLNYQVFPLGLGENQELISVAFDGAGTFGGDEEAPACGCTDSEASNFDPSAVYDDGSCMFDMAGCTDEAACNYDENATTDDGSCVFCGCTDPGAPPYTLTVEAEAVGFDGLTAYRFYVNMNDATDKLSAVFGNNESVLELHAPAGIFNSEFNPSWNASGLASAFVEAQPSLQWDSYATIGLTGPASEVPGASDPDLAEDVTNDPTIAAFFTTGGTDLVVSTAVGGIWYVAGEAANALPDNQGRVLLMQITTAGSIQGRIPVQIFPQGSGEDQVQLSWSFAGTGIFYPEGFGNACGCTDELADNYNPNAVYDDGSCVFGVPGCTNSEACNFDPTATTDDGSCLYAASGYDCDGICLNDADGDGVCDEFEVLGCTNPDATNFDEAATEDDGSCMVMGCTYADAINYNPAANDDDGSCTFDLAGGCTGDFDNSGLVQLNDLLEFLLVYGNECE